MLCRLSLLTLVVLMAGCSKEAPPPPQEEPRAPAVPRVDEAFVRQVAGPDAQLAVEPLVLDLAPEPGQEALLVVQDGSRYELVVARGDRRVLARSPLGGKVLSHAAIRAVGELRALELPGLDGKLFLLPVETLVHKTFVCGMLALRYRADSLVLVGEMGCRCWRAAAGTRADEDPHGLYRIQQSAGGGVLELEEENVIRPYRWDPGEAAFVSQAPRKR